MFTGIIKNTAKVTALEEKDGLSLSIEKPNDWKISIGDSISVNGVCSTITNVSEHVSFTYMPESLEQSNLSLLKVGDLVNLEQALLATDRLDGHIVQGHIDTTAILTSIKDEGNAKILELALLGGEGTHYVVPKGSITLEGISLTVVDVGDDFFTVKIIPHTWEHTNLKNKKEKDALNVEFDILAKYLEKIHANRT